MEIRRINRSSYQAISSSIKLKRRNSITPMRRCRRKNAADPLRRPFSIKLALVVLHMTSAAAASPPRCHNILLRAAPPRVLLIVPCPKISCYFYCWREKGEEDTDVAGQADDELQVRDLKSTGRARSQSFCPKSECSEMSQARAGAVALDEQVIHGISRAQSLLNRVKKSIDVTIC